MTTMRRFRPRHVALAGAPLAVLALALVFAVPARAQEPRKDDALDRLLEKIDPQPAAPGTADSPNSKKTDSGDTPAAKSKPAAESGSAMPGQKPQKPKTGSADEVKDKALDSLLEKLGETRDEPKAKEKPQGGGPGEPSDNPPPPPAGGADGPPGQAKKPADSLAPDKKQIDEHLEELTGVRRRKPQEKKQDPSSGPLGQAVKKMREVEQRLGQDDTGDETREKQKEIVKDLDQLIAQAKQAGGSGSGRRVRVTQQAGSQPGNGSGQSGSTGTGVGPSLPKKPTAKSVLAENKDEWGHLPPELRGEMENVFKEDALPARKTLIDRYYISVTRKSTSKRGD
jgi:hypothetical protein